MLQTVYIKDKVVRGFGRGSKELGCPTANVDNIDHLTIPTGVYCGLAQLVITNKDQVQEDRGYKEDYEYILGKLPYISKINGMVCSFGYNPQFANKNKSLEVHLLENYNFNFYGAEIRVLICKKMRDEQKYNSIEELKEAIANDIEKARNEVINFKKYSDNNQFWQLELANNLK